MRRRPWLAAFLSLMVLGLGHVYNGELGRGVRLVICQVVAVLGGFLLWSVTTAAVHSGPPIVFLLAGLLASPALYVSGIVGAWRGARTLGSVPWPARSWIVCVLHALVVTGGVSLAVPFLVRSVLAQSFRVPAGSMAPTLNIGDHFIANKLIYGPTVRGSDDEVLGRLPGLRRPAVGDVVVFIFPKDRTKDFVKRVVAVARETVELRGTTLLVDGQERIEPYARYEGRGQPDFGPHRVADGYVFVLGDNRNQSYDSRFWGDVPIGDIRGRAEVVYGTTRDGRLAVSLGPVIR